MSNVLTIIEGCPVTLEGNLVRFTARARIDDDGSGPSGGDPDHQGQTSLRKNGQPLNASVDRYVVVPPQILRGVSPIVLGCRASVTWRGKSVDAVVGDIGPHSRIGEISVALAEALGIDANPNTGGVDSPEVQYVLTPGTPADGYALQPA